MLLFKEKKAAKAEAPGKKSAVCCNVNAGTYYKAIVHLIC